MSQIFSANKNSLNRNDQRPAVRCLVVQTARLGDTLQSLMALKAAQHLYPELEITLVVREEFSAAAKRSPWIHQVIEIPTGELIKPMVNGRKEPSQMMPALAKWIRPLVQDPWDFVFNWTFSESSSYLAALIPAKVKLGFSRRPDGTISVLDGWSHYMQAIVQGGIDQNIHTTDILTTQLLTALQIHVGDPAETSDGTQEATINTRQFFSLELDSKKMGAAWKDHSKKWIGIQLGGSHEAKSLEPEHWAGIAATIVSRHPDCCIVLLGGPGDLDRKRRFEIAYLAAFEAKVGDSELARERLISQHDIGNGENSFDLWTHAIGRCQWLLSCDTAAIHLASILGTRVLNVSLGGVKWAETGPYGNGHYVVAPLLDKPCEGCETLSKKSADHICREAISCEAVYGAWSYASSEWVHRRQITVESHFAKLDWSSALDSIQVFRSRVRNAQDGGGVVYESMLNRAMSITEWSAQTIGSVARSWYCGWIPPVAQEIKREHLSTKLLTSLRELDEATQVLGKICDEAARTSQELHSSTSSLKSSRLMDLRARERVTTLGQKLVDLDELLNRTSSTHPTLLGFSRMAKVLMHNLKGQEISDLGRESCLTYQQLSQGVGLVNQWIKATLGLAKPVSLKAMPTKIEETTL